MSWGESSRCRKLQHASSPEPDVVTTLRRCYVNYTGFLFGGEWSSNSPLFGAPGIVRSNAYLPGWWHPSRLRRQPTWHSVFLWYHVRGATYAQQLWRQKLFSLSAHESGTVCRAAYGHLTSATNILRCCWRHMCFDKATALCDILYKRLRNILTYLFTYPNAAAKRAKPKIISGII